VLTKVELFEALETFTPRWRAVYEMGLIGAVAGAGVVSIAALAGTSLLLAQWLVDPDISGDALMGAIMMPAVMAFVFVAAGVRGTYDSRLSRARNMLRAARRGAVPGFFMGAAVVGLGHFLGQLLMSRALYGPLEFQSQILSYCGPIPLLYAVLFALPVALGAAIFAALTLVSPLVVYEAVAAIGKRTA
jgi:hypothetical protein